MIPGLLIAAFVLFAIDGILSKSLPLMQRSVIQPRAQLLFPQVSAPR